MRIGTLKCDNTAVLAPLAGITDLPFRLLAKEAGCGLVYSEMISSAALVRRSAKTLKMLDSCAAEKPLCVQIFGADPSILAQAAQMVQASGADMLDINLGCSVKKILKTGSGAALMKEPEITKNILQNVRRSVDIPLTIKIRTGWDSSGQQAVTIARIAEDCGVDAIAVHPRTAKQGFRGLADWSVITAVKKAVAMPVIGNGDIKTARDALKMEAETGCDGIMIGRAAIGNPLIFSGYLALKNGRRPPVVNISERLATMTRYVEAMVDYWGEFRACRMMRSRLGWFVKGLPHAAAFRESIKSIASATEAIEAIEVFRALMIDRHDASHANESRIDRNTPLLAPSRP
jgi:nifR3 family TIM-barrel protein